MRIDIVADLICPWCFIGKRRLDRALAMRPDLPARRTWRPFQLNPDMPAEGMRRETYMQLKFGVGRTGARAQAKIAAAGEAEGIPFDFDRIRRAPNTLQAHRLIAFAAAEDCAETVVEGLYRGYFIGGFDIGDIDTLMMIAGNAGLHEPTVAAYLGSGAGTLEVLREEKRARRVGIHAVPCFILDGAYAVSGAQEPEMFLPLFDLAAEISRRAPVEA